MQITDTLNLIAIRAKLKKQAVELERQLKENREEQEAVKNLIIKFGDQVTYDVVDRTIHEISDEFRNMSLREAVRTILQRSSPDSMEVVQIFREIREGGYQSKSTNLRPAIYVMLKKLTDSGEVEKVSTGCYKFVKKKDT